MQRYDCDTEQCIVDETRHLRARMLQVKTPFNLFILDHNFWTRNARKSIKRLRLEPSLQWKLQQNTSA